MTKKKAAKPKTRGGEYEPLSRLLGLLSSRWTLLLLHRLHMEGPTRFGELRRRLGSISTKTLTERLRLLEGEGLISRHYEPTVPPQVTYALTKRVMELEPVIIELDRIAERWYGTSAEVRGHQSTGRTAQQRSS
jgi:DNA-binding HxlR family transcriptional regulator